MHPRKISDILSDYFALRGTEAPADEAARNLHLTKLTALLNELEARSAIPDLFSEPALREWRNLNQVVNWEAEFEAWWESHGQFCRSGGGDYEKTFAYRAWEAAHARNGGNFDLTVAMGLAREYARVSHLRERPGSAAVGPAPSFDAAAERAEAQLKGYLQRFSVVPSESEPPKKCACEICLGARGACRTATCDYCDSAMGPLLEAEATAKLFKRQYESLLVQHVALQRLQAQNASAHILPADASPLASELRDGGVIVPSVVTAQRLGETGAPHSEYERTLFEAYMKGHSWAHGEWLADRQYYDDMQTRILFAIWRDRGALEEFTKKYNCGNCRQCLADIVRNGWPANFQRMVVCPHCGDKRCVKAENHNTLCLTTPISEQGSNAALKAFAYEPTATSLSGQPTPSFPGNTQLDPVEGDVLPPVGAKVDIHLGSMNAWVPHTVTGYYVWGDLQKREHVHRMFVRVVDSEGYPNARMLGDTQYPSQGRIRYETDTPAA